MSHAKSRVAARVDQDGETPEARGTLDPQALERARAVVDRLREAYADQWAPAALAEMEGAITKARTSRINRQEHFDKLYRLAHDMKGQGGTFGFPLLSEIGASLCRLTADREYAGETEFRALAAHVAAARRALAEGIADGDSPSGRELLGELRGLVRTQLH